MVFTDCPGLLESHRRRRFCAPLVDTAWRAYQEADVCLFVLDTVKRPDAGLFRVIRALAGSAPCEAHGGAEGSAGLGNGATNWGCHGQQTEGATTDGHLVAVGGEEGYEDGEESPEPRKPVALVLNKIDLVQHKKWVKSRTRELKNHGTFAGVFYTSAKHGIGVENIVQFLKAAARPGHWVYPPDMLTTMSQVQVVEQAVRTYIYCWFNRELPYQVGQKVIGWTRAENGALIIEMVGGHKEHTKRVPGAIRQNGRRREDHMWRTGQNSQTDAEKRLP
ncbi:GTPase [Babesia caballi]|uniref:GTPase n=1 Tax=Babesia caballi TaxID=5871 RepID=A0AAV4LNB3_BABCB|nr:GTPase [Babesia caballi]